jgi:hypothetical protein
MEMAETIGYACFAARGSRGPVDLVCFDNHHRFGEMDDDQLVPLVIQVGTTNKPIASTLVELQQAPRPIGSRCIVARRHKHRTSKRISWTWHDQSGKYESLDALLTA